MEKRSLIAYDKPLDLEVTSAVCICWKESYGSDTPSAKMDISDSGKLGTYLTATILTDDYALKRDGTKTKLTCKRQQIYRRLQKCTLLCHRQFGGTSSCTKN